MKPVIAQSSFSQFNKEAQSEIVKAYPVSTVINRF